MKYVYSASANGMAVCYTQYGIIVTIITTAQCDVRIGLFKMFSRRILGIFNV